MVTGLPVQVPRVSNLLFGFGRPQQALMLRLLRHHPTDIFADPCLGVSWGAE